MELTVNGTTLFVRSVGDGEPCLALHGGPGTDGSGLAIFVIVLALNMVGDALRDLFDPRTHTR